MSGVVYARQMNIFLPGHLPSFFSRLWVFEYQRINIGGTANITVQQ